jgi:hypothetical protein
MICCDGENPLFGPLEGLGPENRFADFHCKVQAKRLDFQGTLLPKTLVMDLPASKSLCIAPYINNIYWVKRFMIMTGLDYFAESSMYQNLIMNALQLESRLPFLHKTSKVR